MLWLAATGALHHPDYIPYFNELVQGPARPRAVRFRLRLGPGHQTPGRAPEATGRHTGQLRICQLVRQAPFWRPIPGCRTIKNIHPLEPAEGWTAVLPHAWITPRNTAWIPLSRLQPWYTYLPVKERVGTIDLLYLAPRQPRRQEMTAHV